MTLSDWQIILDQPAEAPELGFDRYAQAFTDIVLNSPPRFAIGIFGGWGSGKTTLMEGIQRNLKDNKNIVQVEFSAWRYEKEDHLIIPLLDSIQSALTTWFEEQGGNDGKIESLINTIGQVAYSITAGLSFKAGLGDALSVSVDANKALAAAKNIKKEEEKAKIPKSSYFVSFQALSQAFETFSKDNKDRRIVVFIDDLDRCLPKGALSVLESMKLFFDLDGFVFVVGLDKDVIVWSIDNIYKTASKEGETDTALTRPIEGADYIKKIFQVPFELRPVSSDNVEDLVLSMTTEARLPPAQSQVILDEILPHLRFLVSEGGGVNPRDVKRYINNFIMASKTRDPGKPFDNGVFLTLQTLAANPDWQFVYDALRGSRDMFRLALDTYLSDSPDARDALRGYDPSFPALPLLLEDYLRAPDLGQPLVKTDNLSDYLEIGAANLDSTEDVIPEGLATAIADLRSLRTEVSDLALDPQPENSDLSDLSDRFSRIRSSIASNLPTTEFLKLESYFQIVEEKLGFRFPDDPAVDTTGIRLPDAWKTELAALFYDSLSALSYYVNVVRRRPPQLQNTLS
ncbi:P-loop NTPase fold protein [uncultured Roseibium sp.]|uniref:KAP family P-loop NTPase fold protein n=1 Tax=uncultured Roseibium sp. TaxID=1936171 RepID=UPI002616C47C|nr:P-loop NTPase fold protein [uncultured Roseibium sp.]